jgi:hypothetical protein
MNICTFQLNIIRVGLRAHTGYDMELLQHFRLKIWNKSQRRESGHRRNKRPDIKMDFGALRVEWTQLAGSIVPRWGFATNIMTQYMHGRLSKWQVPQDRFYCLQVIASFSLSGKKKKKKKTPWPESASEVYRPSHRRLSTKWFPTFYG